MGNLTCSALDEEEAQFAMVKIDKVEDEHDEPQFRMQTMEKNVFIGIDYTPSPSPFYPRCGTSSRLPGISHLRFDAQRFSSESMLNRSKSERFLKSKTKIHAKRSSLPIALVGNNAVPNMVVIAHFRDMYFAEMAKSSPSAMRFESTRSRPPLDTPSLQSSLRGGYSWANISTSNHGTLRNEIQISITSETSGLHLGDSPYICDGSDSQFAFNVPILSPIFSNKVANFAQNDQAKRDSIIDKIDLEEFEKSKFYDDNCSEDSLAQLIDLLECSSGCGTVRTGEFLPFSPSVGGDFLPSKSISRIDLPNRSTSVGGFALPDTPVFKRIPHSKTPPAMVELKFLAADMTSSELEEFEKEIEELAKKYRNKKSMHAK